MDPTVVRAVAVSPLTRECPCSHPPSSELYLLHLQQPYPLTLLWILTPSLVSSAPQSALEANVDPDQNSYIICPIVNVLDMAVASFCSVLTWGRSAQTDRNVVIKVLLPCEVQQKSSFCCNCLFSTWPAKLGFSRSNWILSLLPINTEGDTVVWGVIWYEHSIVVTRALSDPLVTFVSGSVLPARRGHSRPDCKGQHAECHSPLGTTRIPQSWNISQCLNLARSLSVPQSQLTKLMCTLSAHQRGSKTFSRGMDQQNPRPGAISKDEGVLMAAWNVLPDSSHNISPFSQCLCPCLATTRTFYPDFSSLTFPTTPREVPPICTAFGPHCGIKTREPHSMQPLNRDNSLLHELSILCWVGGTVPLWTVLYH